MSALSTLLIVVYIFVCFALTVVILLQSSKGGGLAGVFGGGGMGAVFGGRGAATFLSRLTTVLAVLFLSIALILSLINRGTTGSSQSLVDQAREKRGSLPAAGLPLVPTNDNAQSLPVVPMETPTSSDSAQ